MYSSKPAEKKKMSLFTHLKIYLRDKNFRKLQNKALNHVSKELDLLKFIRKSRMLVFSTLALLSS